MTHFQFIASHIPMPTKPDQDRRIQTELSTLIHNNL